MWGLGDVLGCRQLDLKVVLEFGGPVSVLDSLLCSSGHRTVFALWCRAFERLCHDRVNGWSLT